MSNTSEEIRNTIISAFKTAHSGSAFSSYPVDYPNYRAVDLEKQSGPFLSIELNFGRKVNTVAIGDSNVSITGELFVNFVVKDGVGMSGAAKYTDMLISTFVGKQISNISYEQLTTTNYSPYKGFWGCMNRIYFTVSA
jgi:hypothetical protein